MTMEHIRLAVVTLFILLSIVTAQDGDWRRQGGRCPRNCAEWQCNFQCRRVGYASGKCYQNPFLCNAYPGRILCACYRYDQQTGTTLPPVVISASVTGQTVTVPGGVSTSNETYTTETPTVNATYAGGNSTTNASFAETSPALPVATDSSQLNPTAVTSSPIISGTETSALFASASVTPTLTVLATVTSAPIDSISTTSTPIISAFATATPVEPTGTVSTATGISTATLNDF